MISVQQNPNFILQIVLLFPKWQKIKNNTIANKKRRDITTRIFG
jgi:hypothetical protein